MSLVQAHSFSSVGHSAKHVAPTSTPLLLLPPLLLPTLPLLATPAAVTVALLLLLLLLLVLVLSVLLLLLQRHFCDSSNMFATVAADVLLSTKLPKLAVDTEPLPAAASALLLLLLRSVYSS